MYWHTLLVIFPMQQTLNRTHLLNKAKIYLPLQKRCKMPHLQSKKECKDQESIQSSITPDPGYQWECQHISRRHKDAVVLQNQEISPLPNKTHSVSSPLDGSSHVEPTFINEKAETQSISSGKLNPVAQPLQMSVQPTMKYMPHIQTIIPLLYLLMSLHRVVLTLLPLLLAILISILQHSKS